MAEVNNATVRNYQRKDGWLPLIPSVKLKIHRHYDAEADEADEQFAQAREKALYRDKMTCQGCGMPTKSTQTLKSGMFEVHHLDDDHKNNHPNNLITLCPLCHSVFHIGFAGAKGRVKIIWLPEISQNDLNLMCHILFILQHQRTQELQPAPGQKDEKKFTEAERKMIVSMGALAKDAWHQLEAFTEDAERILGDGMSNASRFGEMLAWFGNRHPEDYAKRAQLFHGARALPVYSAWQSQVAHWARASNYPEPFIVAPIIKEIYASWKQSSA